jgi:hypothetical protein
MENRSKNWQFIVHKSEQWIIGFEDKNRMKING